MWWSLPISIVVLVFAIIALMLDDNAWIKWIIFGTSSIMVGYNVYLRILMHKYRVELDEDATMSFEQKPISSSDITTDKSTMYDQLDGSTPTYYAYINKYARLSEFKQYLVEGLTLLQHARYTKISTDMINNINKYRQYYMHVTYAGAGQLNNDVQWLSDKPTINEIKTYIKQQRKLNASDESIYDYLRKDRILSHIKNIVNGLSNGKLYFSHAQLIELILSGKIDNTFASDNKLVTFNGVTVQEPSWPTSPEAVGNVVTTMITSALDELASYQKLQDETKKRNDEADAARAKIIVNAMSETQPLLGSP